MNYSERLMHISSIERQNIGPCQRTCNEIQSADTSNNNNITTTIYFIYKTLLQSNSPDPQIAIASRGGSIVNYIKLHYIIYTLAIHFY